MPVERHAPYCETSHPSVGTPTSQSIDWYVEGQARDVEVAGVRVTVRFVGRKGRRARIAITGPAGAMFRALDSSQVAWSPDRST